MCCGSIDVGSGESKGSNISITLCMIVRDEQHTLPRCLDSVAGRVDRIVIVDTGSKDDTIAVAKRYGAFVRKMAWPGRFDSARNFALGFVRTEWTLTLDADDVVETPELIRQVVDQAEADQDRWRHQGVQSFTTIYKQDQVHHQRRLSLFRTRRWRWEGVVHEKLVLAPPDGVHAREWAMVDDKLLMVASDIVIRHDKPEDRREKAAGDYLKMLLEKDPSNFYHIAESYKVLRAWRDAELNYWKAAHWPHVTRSCKYMSLVYCAAMNLRYARENNDEQHLLMANNIAVQALALEPQRAEAAVILGECMLHRGMVSEAQKLFAKAINDSQKPTEADAFWLPRAYDEHPRKLLQAIEEDIARGQKK